MKKSTGQLFVETFLIALMCFCVEDVLAQGLIGGTWEGTFMDQYRAELQLDTAEQTHMTGRIAMYSGNDQIQDDTISDFAIREDSLSFYIPAKATSFQGVINLGRTKFSGHFIFPDGSKHPIDFFMVRSKPNEQAQYEACRDRLYSIEEMRSDLAFLYSALLENHPALHRYVSGDSLDALVAYVLSEMNRPMTITEYYLLASLVTDRIRCSHTGLRLPYTFSDPALEYGRFLPVGLFFEDMRAFLVSGGDDVPDALVKAKTEVLRINGRSIKHIISALSCVIPSEGMNKTTKINGLNRTFPEIFSLLDDSRQFVVEYASGDTSGSFVVQAITGLESKTNSDDLGVYPELKVVGVHNKEVAVLRVPTFGVHDMTTYLTKLEEVFSGLKERGVPELVLDLRDNAGGHPIFAAQLLSFLSDREFTYFKRNADVTEFEPLYNAMLPDPLRFKGDLYVFVNGGCLSTTGHLISLLDQYTEAKFIGEEPGSTYMCNDFSVQFKLPVTGLELNVPRTSFETAIDQAERAFQLDYEIHSLLPVVLYGEDVYFDALEALMGH